MKKRIATLFLLFTGALLLVFAVIPHHHHDEGATICFSVSCCETADTHDRHDSHSHNEADCQLEHFLLLIQRASDDACSCGHSHVHDHDAAPHILVQLFFHSYDITDRLTLETEKRVRIVPYVESAKSKYAGKSQTLRAPPVHIT